jgi:plasmid stabilization system protein ParE
LISVQFHSEAEAEFIEAAAFYESRLVGLGTAFSAEVKTSVGFILAHPEAGSPLGRKLRKHVVRRFPYSLIYRHGEQSIYIVAVAHHRRRPGYWKNR